ncbi:MAG: twin-arginine translocase TatA/TatE family subunit [Bdellovibrionales bacterium]|nr:twin-arginine translocase TatA/TatE family subunit [Bdellovibrionales bacterium]
MFGLGVPELIIIAIVVILLFGTRRLPELGTGLGKAISNFRSSFREGSAIDVTPDKGEDNKNSEKDDK